MTDLSKIVERLRRQAEQTSDASRVLAEMKSLRQDCDPPRADLYAWPTPEETLEWQAADAITALSSARAEAIEEAAREVEHYALKHREGNVKAKVKCEAEGVAYQDNGFPGLLFNAAARIRALSPAPSPAMDVERHKWNSGRPGYGVQCERCGVIQSAGVSLREGVYGNYMDPCPAALSQGEGK